MSPQRQPEPKPFFWVTLDKAKPPERRTLQLHERFSGLSGRMVFQIEVLSQYLYVGSGILDLFTPPGEKQEYAYYSFARRNGQLVIPGTGIKGTVRGVYEALTNSCVSQRGRDERMPESHQTCQGIKKGEEQRASLCPACRLFGVTGYRGRAHFADAIPIGEVQTTRIKISDLWPPRQSKGRKFYQSKRFQGLDMRPAKSHRYLEVVPKGSRFETTLVFENLEEAEMGALLRALGLGPSLQKPNSVIYAFPIKLGGAKPRCLGSVRFVPRAIYLVDATDPLGSLVQGGRRPDGLTAQLRQWLDNVGNLLDQTVWERFLQEAKPQNELCPVEVY
jgi:CRISPR/Cas system CSM-associated protein Csm3 (group 7 of RAMP superfamily)